MIAVNGAILTGVSDVKIIHEDLRPYVLDVDYQKTYLTFAVLLTLSLSQASQGSGGRLRLSSNFGPDSQAISGSDNISATVRRRRRYAVKSQQKGLVGVRTGPRTLGYRCQQCKFGNFDKD